MHAADHLSVKSTDWAKLFLGSVGIDSIPQQRWKSAIRIIGARK